MGSELDYVEERPVHRVSVSGFAIDITPVTNAEFARFVEATGYVTVAERPLAAADFPNIGADDLAAGSLVFTPTPGPVDLRDVSQWWTWTPGACWRHPRGEGSEAISNRPVVHVAHSDAAAYADWAGGELPTEVEWEFAARGGLDDARYAWGQQARPDGRTLANIWEGEFPWQRHNGPADTSPVASYPANGYGLFDMIGNVWEWTDNWWRDHHVPVVSCCPSGPATPVDDPFQPGMPLKVVKGGSYLCADNYCHRYRPAARVAQAIETATSHIGFRCVYRGTR